jgi:hypothetical protein
VTAFGETTVAVDDCTGARTLGTLERDGTIRLALPVQSETVVMGCTVSLATALAVPAATSPTAAAYTFVIELSGLCPLGPCTIEAAGVWQRP